MCCSTGAGAGAGRPEKSVWRNFIFSTISIFDEFSPTRPRSIPEESGKFVTSVKQVLRIRDYVVDCAHESDAAAGGGTPLAQAGG